MPSPTYAVTAFRYPSMAAAGAAYERVHEVFAADPDSGDSLYRLSFAGGGVVALLAWNPTPERLAALTDWPWGDDGEAILLPPEIAERLARRSLASAPAPNQMRRIHRGPTGCVLRDRTRPDTDQ